MQKDYTLNQYFKHLNKESSIQVLTKILAFLINTSESTKENMIELRERH